MRKDLIFALLVFASLWLSRGTTRALLMSGQSLKREQSPSIIITPQDGAPLQILSTWIASAKPQSFRLMAQVQNQSVKGIRAYLINSQIAGSKQQNGHSQLINLTQRSAFWQPTEIRTVELGDSLKEQVKSVRLTVDFIEFADGTAWGPDSANSRDLLAGQREGARLTRQHLRGLMQNKGQEAMALEIQTGDGSQVETAIKGKHSGQWIEGFRMA